MTEHPEPPGPPSSSSPPPPPPPPPPNLMHQTSFTPAPSSVVDLKRTRTLGRRAGELAIASALVALIGLWPAANDRARAIRFLNDEISQDDSIRDILGGAWLEVLEGGLLLATVIVSIVWLYRVLYNLSSLQRTNTWGSGWAVAGWFLPPGIYVIPALVLQAAWKGSDPDVPLRRGWKQGKANPIIWVWFLTYSVIPVIIGLASADIALAGFSSNPEVAAQAAIDIFGYTVVSSIIGLIGAVLWFVVTRQITQRHTELVGEAN